MGIVSIVTDTTGQINVNPRRVKIITTDSLATVTTAGYLNTSNLEGYTIYPTDVIDMWYSYVSSGNVGTYEVLTTSISNGVITLVSWANPGDVLLPVVSGDFATFNGTTGQIKDAGYSPSDPAKTKVVMANGSTVANNMAVFTDTAGTIDDNLAAANTVASSSATPGSVRVIKGVMSLTNTTYANTTNSVAGVRGEVDMIGASSGYVYGVQGKVIPTGTLSGSIWAPAVFGQYDLSAATINAGQIAAVWGDMGATGGTFTNVTGARMFAGTNTIASLTLNSMIYLYGKATNLLELSGSSSTYISDGGGGSIGGTVKKIAFTIDGVTYYLVAGTTIT